MAKSHKYNVEQKKSETKEYILCNCICSKFKKDKTNLMLKVKVVNLKRSKNSDRKQSSVEASGALVTFSFLTCDMSVFICSWSLCILHL